MIQEIENEQNKDHVRSSIFYVPPKEKEPIIARIFSIILHPLFMVLYAVILIFIHTDFKFLFANQFVRFMTPILFFSCIVPVTGMYFLKISGTIQNFNLNNKKEWLLPFSVFFLSYGLLFYYFFSAKLYIWFLAVVAVPMILLIVYTIISRFWDISAHMIGMGGLIGSIMSVCYNIKGLNLYILFIILFILAGCLGVSRLAAKKSTPAQVYVGFLIGIIISYLTVYAGAYWGFVIFLKSIN